MARMAQLHDTYTYMLCVLHATIFAYIVGAVGPCYCLFYVTRNLLVDPPIRLGCIFCLFVRVTGCRCSFLALLSTVLLFQERRQAATMPCYSAL
jgi:hypothetical protein